VAFILTRQVASRSYEDTRENASLERGVAERDTIHCLILGAANWVVSLCFVWFLQGVCMERSCLRWIGDGGKWKRGKITTNS
jgi:hypothetical protein